MILRQFSSSSGIGKGRKASKKTRNYRAALKKQIRTKIKQPQRHERTNEIRALLPYALFLGIVIIFSLAVYGAEVFTQREFDIRTISKHKCIGHYGYAAAVFYVLSATTTIGYGEIRPCTVTSKIFGATCTLVGLPIVLVVLSDIGTRLCGGIKRVMQSNRMKSLKSYFHGGLNMFWLKKHKHCNSVMLDCDNNEEIAIIQMDGIDRGSPVEDVLIETAVEYSEELADLPISIGILLSLCCILTCSLYYWIELNFDFGHSVYYAILTFIGGDFACNRFEAAIPVFMIVIIGFSMFSLTLNIIQMNIANAIIKIRNNVLAALARYQSVLAKSDVPIGDVNFDEIINKIVADVAGPIGKSLIPTKELVKLKLKADKTINKVDVGTQCSPKLPKKMEKMPNQSKQLLKKKVPVLSRGISANPLKFVATKETNIAPFLVDGSTLTVSWVSDQFQQTKKPIYETAETATDPNPKVMIQTDWIKQRDALIDTKPKDVKSVGTNAHNHVRHMRINAVPQTRNVRTMFPRF